MDKAELIEKWEKKEESWMASEKAYIIHQFISDLKSLTEPKTEQGIRKLTHDELWEYCQNIDRRELYDSLQAFQNEIFDGTPPFEVKPIPDWCPLDDKQESKELLQLREQLADMTANRIFDNEVKDKRIVELKTALAMHCIIPEFISHPQTESWGKSNFTMEKEGRAFCRLYYYDDENTTVYLEGLSVVEEARRQGIGTELFKLMEYFGICLGATISNLWVDKDSWMFGWYSRMGYEYLKDHEDQENCVWMKKSLT